MLRDGLILNNRYRIVKQIGRGGFGRAYLAEDTHRYRELCVLKEFAPQVESDRDLRKAEELFERESGILYKLQHQQIPKFEALLQTKIDGRRSLFLVQEYIPGDDYWELLKEKGKLSEIEVKDMIWDLLPVLDFIHSSKLIHRDISPDNLIRRDLDGKTVLIDFGCVKVAANALSRSAGTTPTIIGKKGYSPEEQLRRGQAFPSSDLYSLAVTAVVLLTGKQPDELYDSQSGKWHWESQVRVSPVLRKVLNKMLADKPGDRYQSADRVLSVLSKEHYSPVNSFISQIRTLVIAPSNRNSSNTGIFSNVPSTYQSGISRIRTKVVNASQKAYKIPLRNIKQLKPWQWGMISAGVFLIPGLLSFTAVKTGIYQAVSFKSDSIQPVLNQSEKDFQQEIYRRVESLNLDDSAFYKQVDQIFHDRHPELRGLQLTEKPEHQPYRQMWYEIASSLLNKQERSRN